MLNISKLVGFRTYVVINFLLLMDQRLNGWRLIYLKPCIVYLATLIVPEHNIRNVRHQPLQCMDVSRKLPSKKCRSDRKWRSHILNKQCHLRKKGCLKSSTVLDQQIFLEENYIRKLLMAINKYLGVVYSMCQINKYVRSV